MLTGQTQQPTIRQEPTTSTKRHLLMKREGPYLIIKNKQLGKTVRYDLKNKRMEKQHKDGGWNFVQTQYDFFRGYTLQDIKTKDKHFLELIAQTKRLNPLCTSLSTFIARLSEALVYEHYIQAGIETQAEGFYGGWYGSKHVLTKPLEYYSKRVIQFWKTYNIKVTTTLENQFVQDYKYMTALTEMLLDIDFTPEEKKETYKALTYGGCSEDFRALTTRFNYDTKSLLRYLVKYLKPYENLQLTPSINLLHDYYDMASQIGRDVKKYPKYLRSIHDIITANHNAYKQNYDEQRFEQLRQEQLQHTGPHYCMVVPSSTKDVITEGTSLNHCVSSYIPRILNQETYIMFLRSSKMPDVPLVTIEYQDGRITQAKGAYNRPLDEKEREYLDKYGKEKGILIEITN